MAGLEYALPESSGYRMIRRLGSGGEGTVYLVCHINTEQLRAAKVLTNIREDCRHELNMMKNLNHPSLPKVIDILEEGKNTWLIMEYIHGRRLDQIVTDGIGKNQLWSVACQLAQVLVYLHGRKKPVLHLDIKPSNILIRPDESLVLIDFGASIRGHPDDCVNSGYGTPGFAAPEQQAEGASVDVRTDLFGAGALLYYCCYGKTPDSGRRRFRKSGIDRIIAKCLQEEPDRRYRDSREFYKAVCHGMKSEKRHKVLRGCFGAGVLLLLSSCLLFTDLQSGKTKQMVLSSLAFGEPDGMTETEVSADAENYTRLLNMAAGLGFTQAIECYREASSIFPEDEKWYLSLLEQVTADGIFEEAEEEAVKDLIYAIQSQDGATALELLEEHSEAFGLVAYRLGLSYWYFYGGSGGKSAAAGWFQRALRYQEENTDAEWLATAEILARIGSYYGMLGSTDTDVERSGKEWDYWNDLKSLWKYFRIQEESEDICCETAEEILSLLALHASDFRLNGETWETMKATVDDIEEYLSNDSRTLETAELERQMGMVQTAGSAIERAFQN